MSLSQGSARSLLTQKRQVARSNPVLQRIETVQRTTASTIPVIIGVGRKTPSNHTIQTLENTESVIIHSLHPKIPLFTTLPNINPSLLSNEQIATQLKLNRLTVRTWRNRWVEAAEVLATAEAQETDKDYQRRILDLLEDNSRGGAPSTFSAEQICQIVDILRMARNCAFSQV